MRSNKAFTLVELMIVISIVGMLSTIAIPKFADMMRKANEAVTKSNLGVLMSVTSIYYADHDGVWPYQQSDLGGDDECVLGEDSLSSEQAAANAWVPKYVSDIAAVRTGVQGYPYEGYKTVMVAGDTSATYDYGARSCGGAVAWIYMRGIGAWYINCEELDTKDEGIHTW